MIQWCLQTPQLKQRVGTLVLSQIKLSFAEYFNEISKKACFAHFLFDGLKLLTNSLIFSWLVYCTLYSRLNSTCVSVAIYNLLDRRIMTSLLTFFTSPSITHQLKVHVKAGFSEDSPHQDVIRAQSSFGTIIWKGWLGMLDQDVYWQLFSSM